MSKILLFIKFAEFALNKLKIKIIKIKKKVMFKNLFAAVGVFELKVEL